ncbi:MAG: pyridoxamine 5'-phosphate oxidase family protein [Pseudomonadota bacterium]
MIKDSFTQEEIEAFRPAEKIGLVASLDPMGSPHVTLITSIMAVSPSGLTLGEFCKGRSKEYIQKNPNIAFLIMTPDRRLWRGKARWTHLKKEGPEYEMYNEIPMFRYNAYFRINTVHYLDLLETSSSEELPMSRIVRAAIFTKLAKAGARRRDKERILKPFAEDLFNKMDSLKFIAYVGKDGFPVIIPAIQCQAADSRRLAFSPNAYKEELVNIPKGAQVAVFALTMGMEDVLVRGTYRGVERVRFLSLGIIDIEWVYNSMPPAHGQIYPELELKPVVNF